MICSNCGQPLDEGKLFCGNCGHLNSNASQPQKILNALEVAKTSKYDLFALGWAALISFSLARHFMFLPEITSYIFSGRFTAPLGFIVPSLENSLSVNLAFVFLVVLNILSVKFVLTIGNKVSKNISGTAGTILILLSSLMLIVTNMIDISEIFTFFFLFISEIIFYLGINVLAISKINDKGQKFISSGVSGITIGLLVSFIFPIVSSRLYFLTGLMQITLTNLLIIVFAFFTFTQKVNQQESNGEIDKAQVNKRLFVIGLFFAPLVVNFIVGYMFYLLYYL